MKGCPACVERRRRRGPVLPTFPGETVPNLRRPSLARHPGVLCLQVLRGKATVPPFLIPYTLYYLIPYTILISDLYFPYLLLISMFFKGLGDGTPALPYTSYLIPDTYPYICVILSHAPFFFIYY